MATPQLSQEEGDKPMKVWQGAALDQKITEVRDLVKGVADNVSGTASQKYVDSSIEALRKEMKASMLLMEKEYRPALGSLKWAGRVAIATFITIAVTYIVAAGKK